MKFGKAIAVSAAALIIGMATPALAQSGVNEQGDGSADNNTTVDDTANDFLDLLSNNDILSENGNGNNRDNEANDNGDNRDNDDNGNNRDNDDNGNNRDNETENYGDGSASRGGEVEDNGNNRDNENYGDGSASRGGEVEDNGDNRDNDDNGNNRDNETENYGDGSASRGGEVSDNGNNRDNGDESTVVGVQVLTAVITNNGMDEIVDIDSDQNGHTVSTGDAYIRGNAFAAFAGINSQAFNTGQNANVQSATNIAASGTVNFGSAPE